MRRGIGAQTSRRRPVQDLNDIGQGSSTPQSLGATGRVVSFGWRRWTKRQSGPAASARGDRPTSTGCIDGARPASRLVLVPDEYFPLFVWCSSAPDLAIALFLAAIPDPALAPGGGGGGGGRGGDRRDEQRRRTISASLNRPGWGGELRRPSGGGHPLTQPREISARSTEVRTYS